MLYNILAEMPDDTQRGIYIKEKVQETIQGNPATFLAPIPKPRSKAAIGEYTEEFERFWQQYPKKTGKGGAFVVWQKVANGQLHLDCIAALKWQIPVWMANEKGKYIPNPETYLSKRRWEDEPPEQKTDTQTYVDMDGIRRSRS